MVGAPCRTSRKHKRHEEHHKLVIEVDAWLHEARQAHDTEAVRWFTRAILQQTTTTAPLHACTSGDGEGDTQDPLQHTLLPVEFAPMFAATAASRTSPSPQPRVFSPRATQMSVEHADLSEYANIEAVLGPLDTRCPPGIGYMALDRVTLGSGPSDLAEFEVPVVEKRIPHGGLTLLGLCADDPPTRWVCSCVELPGYAWG